MLGISDGSVVISGNKVTSTLLEWADVPVVDLIQSKIKIPVCTVSRAGALIQVEIEKLARPAFGQKKYLLINCGLGLGTAFQIIGGASRDDISPQVQISHVSLKVTTQFVIVGSVAAWNKQELVLELCGAWKE